MEYDREATDRSKALLAYFFLVCIGVAIFSDMAFGLWWLLLIPAGMILIPLAGGLLNLLHFAIFRKSPLESVNSLTVMVGHLLIGTVGSYYLLKLAHNWIA